MYRPGGKFVVAALTLALMLALSAAGCGGGDAGRGEARNVLLVTIDTLRADHFPCSSPGRAGTPFVRELLEKSACYTNCTSAAFGTTPSHASIMTSLHARRHGVYNNRTPLPEEALTAAEIFKARGWMTAAFVSALPLHSRLRIDQGFDMYNQWFDPGMGKIERTATQATDAALYWFENNLRPPFFAWVHYFDPHTDYDPPAAFRNSRLDPDSLHPADGKQDGGYRSYSVNGRDVPAPASEYYMKQNALYAGEVSYVDSQLRRLVGWFEDSELMESTMIVIVADHGETLDETGHEENYNHTSVYEEVARVPLIVYLPGGGAAGTVLDEPVSTLDILPSILAAVGIEDSGGFDFDGVALEGIIEARDAGGADSGGAAPRPVFFETAHRNGAGVRLGNWKYLRLYSPDVYFRHSGRNDEEQLFNLELDPAERRNLIHDSHAPADRLRRLLDEWERNTPRTLPEPDPGSMPGRDFNEKLKELGYL